MSFLGSMNGFMGIGASQAAPKFHYYVDPAAGNDANIGTSELLPKKTVASIPQRAGLRIGVKAGTEARESVTLSYAGMLLGVYGLGLRPAFIGSTRIETTWANVSGNVWSTSLASSPTNLYLVTLLSNDGITKLTKNTASPTAPSAGQWGHSSGVLYVYSAIDPNTLRYERVTASSASVVRLAASKCRAEDVGAYMATANGVSFEAEGTQAINVDASHNANDNFNGTVSGKTCLIDLCYGWWAGTSAAKSITGSDGDGVSFHGDGADGFSSVTITRSDFRYNRKSGIGCQSACIVNAFGNVCLDNYADIAIFPTTYTGTVPMVQTFAYNICRRSAADGYTVNFGSSLAHALTINLHNNTFYSPVATASQGGIFVLGSAQGGADLTMNIKNCIISGFARGIDSRDASATLVLENNCVSGNTTNYFDNGTRSPALSTIAVDSTTSDPLFTDAALADFSLQSGSPCIDAGQDLGYITDQAGNSIIGLPDIGALERLAT